MVLQVPPGGTALPGGPLCRDSPGPARQAASCTSVGFREKGIKTVRQDWLSHSDTCAEICNFPFTSCSLLKAKSRLHRLNLMHAKKGPVSSPCLTFLHKRGQQRYF